MELTKTERLLIANQFRILAFLDSDNEPDCTLKAEIAEHGYPGLYPELFHGMYQ